MKHLKVKLKDGKIKEFNRHVMTVYINMNEITVRFPNENYVHFIPMDQVKKIKFKTELK